MVGFRLAPPQKQVRATTTQKRETGNGHAPFVRPQRLFVDTTRFNSIQQVWKSVGALGDWTPRAVRTPIPPQQSLSWTTQTRQAEISCAADWDGGF